MAVPERQPLRRVLPIFMISAGICFMALIRLLWDMIRLGPKQLFHVKSRTIRPDVLDDPALGQHNFARLKRLKLHYVSNGAEDKPLMLFLHGFPEMWYSWRHQLKAFGKDFRAVAVDMRGYGESDKPSGVVNYTMDKLVNDVKELIEILGYENCYLVAHDWGGAVAWAFAEIHPSMVQKLVVCNCPNSRAFQKLIQTSTQQKKKSWYMAFFQMPCFPEMMVKLKDLQVLDDGFRKAPMGAKMGSITDDDVEASKYTYSQPGALTGPLNYYRAAFQYMPATGRTGKITVPSLMVWGTNDAALGKELAEMSGDYVEDYRIKYVEGASHWVQQEEPEIVNQHIREFIKDQ